MTADRKAAWSDQTAAAVMAILGDDDLVAWQDKARCAETDPEIFFAEKGASVRPAKRTCMACEVRAECLQYAMEHDERFGVWGGLSERERRRLRRKREAASGAVQTCTGCGETKPVTEFHHRAASGYERRCKTCRRQAPLRQGQQERAA
jgi:WhiB family redox-sensing transcriptional regulator